MPIGAYDPWIWNHCTPEQAVAMADAAGARLFVPVHHQSFQLSREPFMEPIERAQEALIQERIASPSDRSARPRSFAAPERPRPRRMRRMPDSANAVRTAPHLCTRRSRGLGRLYP